MAIIIVTYIILLDDVKHTEGHGGRYDKPYFIAWFNHSWLTLCLLPALLMFPQLPGGSSCSRADITAYIRRSGFSPDYFVYITAGLSVLFQGVNYFWALALPHEGNDCFVCMSQLVFGVVFVLSAFSGERQSLWRFVAVVIALAGVFISAWQADIQTVKHKTSKHKEDILALVIYCIVAAIFQVLFKRLLGGAERRIAVIWLFIGMMGLFTTLALWPGLILVHALGFEKMEAPPASDWAMILFISGLYLAHNTCCIIGIALTSPLTVGVVKAMAIPLTFLSDFLRGRHFPTDMELFAAALITLGFLGTIMSKDIIDDVDFGYGGARVYADGDEERGLMEEDDSSDDEEQAGLPSPLEKKSLQREAALYDDSDDDLLTGDDGY